MFRKFWLPILLSIVASPLWGQDTLVDRLRIRAESLLRTWQQAVTIANLADSLERERATSGRDTIAVGALRILTNPSPLPLRQAAALAWPAIDSLYGSAAADLAQRPYVIRAADPDSSARRAVLHVGVEVPWDLDLRATTMLLLTTVPVAPPDRPLGEWLTGGLRPAIHPREDRTAVYLELVTAPSQATRGCFLGDIARCIDALGLGDTAHLLERWYPSAAERRAIVSQSFADFFNHGDNVQPFRECVAGRDTSCTALLRSLPPGALPKPLTEAARVSLVRDALRLGGRDAYRRLLRDPETAIGDRLAQAAGVGVDSLVAGWRNAALAARPAPVALPWWAIGVAVGWVTVFAGCGLSSSRWRA